MAKTYTVDQRLKLVTNLLQIVAWLNIIISIGAIAFTVSLLQHGKPLDQSLFGGSTTTLILSIVALVIARGITQRKKWAWAAGVTIAIIQLLNIPIGTIIGGVILYNLFSDGVKNTFDK